MKINNSILFLKLFSFVLVVFSLAPIIEIEIFYLFIVTITIIIFSKIRYKIRYPILITVILLLLIIKFFQNFLYFDEGNNILILNEKSKTFYQKYLPLNMYNFIEKEFEFYNQNSTCNSKNDKCWRSFDPTIISKKGSPNFSQYAPSMYLEFKNKYSRKLKNLKIDNLKSARISEINNLRYNYFWGDKFDLVRENIPFFIMIEIRNILIDSHLCWKGNVFWEEENYNFKYYKNKNYACKKIEKKDLNKKVYAVSLGTSETNDRLNYLYGDNYLIKNDKLDKFLKKNELIFELKKSNYLLILNYVFIILTISLIFIFIGFSFRFNYKVYLFGTLFPIVYLILIYYSSKDLFYGFTIYTGGNDGLVYNSYSNNIFHYLKTFDLKNVLLGVEKIFYFPSAIRYFLALFKIIFSDTNYGYQIIGYFFCIIIFLLFIRIFGYGFGIFFSFLVICTRVLEGYGASIIKLLKHINSYDAEPFAMAIFFTCLYIFTYCYENKNYKNNILSFTFGLLSFFIVSLRPNYLPTVLLLLLIQLFYLNKYNRINQIIITLFGFCFIFLIPLHNLYFGDKLVFFSSGHIHNTGVPISVYSSALIDIMQLNLINSSDIKTILVQFKRWIKPDELHYLLTFIILFYVIIFKANYFRIISILALSQHVVLLIFEPTGRYSYLAWFLSIIVFLYIVKEIIRLFFSKIKYSMYYLKK